MKKDLLQYFVYYFITGVIVLVLVLFIINTIDNFRVAINFALIMLGILVLGAVVYEGINYIYKKWSIRKEE